MTADDKTVSGIIDFMPSHAKNERLRPQLENDLKQQLVQEVPEMVKRLKKLDPLITLEVEGYADFMLEAQQAFQYGFWRAVIALIGIAAERFTDNLYRELKWVMSADGKEISKTELLGDRPSFRSKLALFRVLGLIGSANYNKLVRIRRLRDLYVHPKNEARDAERDALIATRLFRSILKERFDQVYTIKNGKIVKR